MKYNVAVIGAGPAGLMAAGELEKAGISFIVIDSKKEVGFPLKCGEGIRKKGFLELFGKASYPFVKNETCRCMVISGKTRREFKADYLMLDRPSFEQWLAEPVKDRINLQTELIDIEKKKNCMEIITGRGRIYADIVVLCSGANYAVQKKFSLLIRPPYMVPCFGGIFNAKKIDRKTIYFFFEDSCCTGLWAFPKEKGKANVGIGAMPYSKKANIRDLFDKAVKQNNLQLSGKSFYGGSFPTSGPIRRTYADRLLVCGNAAGLVYAGSGEGIYFALKSGKLAGETAAEAVKNQDFSASFLKKYEKGWKKEFGNQLEASLAFARILFLGFKYRKLDKLFALPSEKHLIDMFLNGKLPLKARIFVLLDKALGFSRRKSGSLPFTIIFLSRLYKLLRP